MKKIISVVLALVMVLSSFAMINVSAATASTVEIVADDTVTLGDKFDVYIAVTEYNGVTSIGFNPVIDTEYLTDSTVAADALLVSPGIQDYDGTVAVFMPANGTMDSYIAAAPGERLVKLTYTAAKVGTTTITVNVSESNATGDSESVVTKTITIAEDAPAEPIVYTGNAIELSGSMVDGAPALNDAGNMEAAVKAGTGADDTRIYIKTAGAPKTMPYMAIGMKLTNANKTADNFCPMWGDGNRLWSGGAAGGQNQAFSATEIKKHVADYTVFTDGEAGGWSSVGENDKLIGVAVNAWSTTGTAPTGTVEVAYVAFFATKAEAEAYTGPDLDADITPDVLIEAADVAYVNIRGWTGAYNEETGLFTATTEAAISNSTNDSGYVQIGLGKTAVGTPAIKYAKIGYKYDKAGLAHETSDNVNVGMTIGGTSGRFWGFDVPQFEAAEGDWLVNLDCTGKDGEHIVGQYANAVATDTYDYLRLTPWKRGSTIPAGTTFSVEYIAFFSDANDAANYVYEGGEGGGNEEETPSNVIYAKDVPSYTMGSVYNGVKTVDGNTVIFPAYTEGHYDEWYDNDDCCIVTATGLEIPVANKYYVIAMASFANKETGAGYTPSTTDNVRFFVDNAATDYVDVDLASHNGTELYAHVIDASALLTSGTNVTKIEFDPIPNTKKGGIRETNTRFGKNGQFSLGFIAAFDSLAAAEAYAAEFNGGEEATKVEVTYMLDGQVIATQKYTPGEALVYPEVEAPKGYEITGWNVDEGTIVEDAMTVQAFFNEVELPLVEEDVLGKDLEIAWNGFYKHASCNGKVEVVGNNTVATGSSNWENNWNDDRCSDFTIKNIPVDGKYLILNVEATSDSAKLSTADNILINGHTRSFDFTAGTQITIDLSEVGLGDATTIDSIRLSPFAHKGGQLKNVKVVVGSVSTVPYAITLDGELVAVADEGALYELPVAVSDEAGMRFVGWTDGTDMYLAGTKVEMSADLVLTPEFEAATEWYVTYIVNGEVYKVVTVALDGEVAHPTAPAMAGYKFAGWYNEAGERVINGDAVTNDMTLTANFTEAGDDEEFLGTFLTILKMITAKKANGGSTAGGSQAGTTAASSTPVAVYTGEQITVKPQGSIASAEAAVNAAGNVEVALPAGTGADGTRIYIVTEGADMTTPFMAVGLKITNAAKDKDVFNPIVNESKRLWGANNADAGANQTFSATKIENHVVDFTAFADGEISGGWSGVTSSDVLTGVSVNAWTYDQAFAAGTMEIAYVAFFKTLDDAKAYVHGAVAEEAPAEEPKEEVKEEEPVVSAGAILGKDLEIEWGSYWTHAGNNPVIAAVGNNTVATGDSNWQNDGCSIFTIKNVKIEKGAKTLVLNIKASSEGEAPARPSTANNIVITAGGNSKTYSFDFTNATEELTAIELDISNFKNVTKLDSIQLDVFANNKVETAVGNLYGVEVIIGAIECK